jgi:hypothetical protein
VDPDPNPSIFIVDLQDVNKKLIKKKFFRILFFEGTFKSFFKGKRSKRRHKTVEIKRWAWICMVGMDICVSESDENNPSGLRPDS